MKKLILVLAMVTAPVMAQQHTIESTCAETAELAGLIMELRQGGVDLAKMLETQREDASELQNSLVLAAYKRPRFQTKPSAMREISGFRNDVHIFCLENGFDKPFK